MSQTDPSSLSPSELSSQVSDAQASEDQQIADHLNADYAAGFVTDIESDTLAPGLDESTVRFISAKKEEPQWLTDWRLKAYARWQTMQEPEWAHLHYPKIIYNDISYYSAPRSLADAPESLDDVDPELIETYNKLGIPLHEQEMLAGVVRKDGSTPEPAPGERLGPPGGPNVAVDAVFDSVSVATTFKACLLYTSDAADE